MIRGDHWCNPQGGLDVTRVRVGFGNGLELSRDQRIRPVTSRLGTL
jgi:hypothetical protein